MEDTIETTIMQLIIHAGDARSLAIEAIRNARKGSLELAQENLNESKKKMTEAHTHQTKLIFAETNGDAVPISLLMIHAQDHVMNAMTIREIAVEVVGLVEDLQKEKI